jgi:pilus assembly protein CpaB
MNRNVVIVLAGAFMVAVVVALLVQVTLGGKKQGGAEPKTQILVAALDLAIGRELKEGDTRWQDWPQASLFPGAVVRDKDQSATEALEGRLARPIAQGEPVVKSAMLGQVKGNMVAASLGPGMRAVAIEVKASSMVGGFIGPGDYIDVMLTYKASANTDDEDPRIKEMLERSLNKMATETVLQNIKVLAIDQTAKRPEEDKVKVGKTVTLEVTVKDAERLFLASRIGDLSLALRGVGDNTTVQKDWATISDARLTSMTSELLDEYEKYKEEAGIHGDSVRIYSGGHVSVERVR